MGSIEINTRMTCNLLESCEIFNSLFGKITTIQSNHNHIKSVNPVHEINSSTLTSDQKHAIKQLAGVLMDMSVIIPSMSKTSSIDSSDNIEKVAELDQHTVNHNLLERKQKRTISALQDYLYQELTRCEELESKLQAKEMELVNVVVERDKYLKKCQQENLISSQSHSRAISSSLNQSATSAKANFDELDTFTPQEWIGRYIRKGFGSSYYFGIVVSYDAPYFKVIYEDADAEELAKSEINRLFWLQTVPSHKVEQIKKHSRGMFAKHSQLQVQSSVTTLSTSIDNKEDKSENESEDNDSVTGTSFMETGEEKNASTDNIDMDDEFDIKSSDNQSLKRSKVGDSI